MACKTKSSVDNRDIKLTAEQEKILRTIAGRSNPVSSREISEAAGIAPKSVSCRIQSLKKKGLIISPARCKYEITDTGRTVIQEQEGNAETGQAK